MDPAEPNPLLDLQNDLEPIQPAASIKPESTLVRALKNISPFTYCFAAVFAISLISIAYFMLQNLSLKSQLGMNSLKWPWVNETCTYQGTEFKPGESVPSVDGCNSCSCDESGQVMCTLMACAQNSDVHTPTTPISDWQTFSNDLYFYQISYPADWEPTESILTLTPTPVSQKYDGLPYGAVVRLYKYLSSPTEVRIPFLEIHSWPSQKNEYEQLIAMEQDVQEISISGQVAYISSSNFDREAQRIYHDTGRRQSVDIFNQSHQLRHELICLEDRLNFGVCDQILSTFQFLDGKQAELTESETEAKIRQAVEEVLASPYMLNPQATAPQKVRLSSVQVTENKIVLDLSQEIIVQERADFEDKFSQISNAIHPIIQGDGANPKYPELILNITIEGKPVDSYF